MENIEHYNSELFCTKKMLILKKWLFCCLRRDTQACGSSASHCQSLEVASLMQASTKK